MDFKSYFHNQYQGGESFIEEVIIPIFGEDKYEEAYDEDMLESNPELETMAASTGISQIIRLGRIDIPLNPTDVFDITVKDHVQMERNRVAIQLLVRRIMSTYSSAFMVFHYDDTPSVASKERIATLPTQSVTPSFSVLIKVAVLLPKTSPHYIRKVETLNSMILLEHSMLRLLAKSSLKSISSIMRSSAITFMITNMTIQSLV